MISICFTLPIILMIGWSVAAPAFTARYYAELFSTPVYLRVITNTVRIGLVTTALCVAIGYPLSYWIRGRTPTWRMVALALVALPFWVSILVRTYAWIVMLGNAGLVNRALLALGIVGSPLTIIYNEFGVIVGTVNVLLPFFVLPMVSAMLRIDDRLMQAASSLGASRRVVFWRVFFPLTVPALAAGAVLVFILTLGFYITPAVLGGGRVTMVANLLDTLINRLPNWELAAAISTVLLVSVMLLNAVSARLRNRNYG